MRKLFLTIAGAAVILAAGMLTYRADAMTLGAPAAVRAAADDVGLVDKARLVCRHWWDGVYYRRLVCREIYGGPVVVQEPPAVVVAPRPYYAPYYRPAPGFGIYISDIRVKRDIAPLQRLANGLELYSYRYLWSDQVYVGVMAQEVQAVRPDAVTHGADGLLRVDYKRLGLRLQTLEQWKAAHAREASAQ
jgi:hypothetical protein